MSERLRFPMFRLTFAGAVAASALLAQEQPEAVIRTETRLVLVRFHVVRDNRFVSSLNAGDFELAEDGAPRKIAFFESASTRAQGETTPVEVFLLLDVSDSVINPSLLDTALLKQTFLDGIGSRASIAVYAFGRRTRRFTPPTSDPARLKDALGAAYDFAHPGTRLYESIAQVAREAASRPGSISRIMIVLSDGLDTTRTKPEAATEAALAAGIPVYPVVLGHERVARRAQQDWGGNVRNPRQVERQARAAEHEGQMFEFAEVGKKTGGQCFDPPIMNNSVLKSILQGLVGQIRAEYVIGYYLPPAPAAASAKKHKVQIRIRDKRAGKLIGGSRTVVY